MILDQFLVDGVDNGEVGFMVQTCPDDGSTNQWTDIGHEPHTMEDAIYQMDMMKTYDPYTLYRIELIAIFYPQV